MPPAAQRSRRSITASLGAPDSLFPLLSSLFEGVDSLGSTPRRVCTLLARGGVGDGSRVLDIACGKGAIAVEAAATIGCRVRGEDAFAPFIARARELAEARAVSHLVSWRVADADGAPRGPYDAAMMIGLFGFERAAPLLHARVRRGGLYILDDALLRSRADHPDHTLPTRADARLLFHELGDEVIAERALSARDARSLAAAASSRLASNAASLAAGHPRLRTALRRFVQDQLAAADLLSGPLRPVLWAVRRGR